MNSDGWKTWSVLFKHMVNIIKYVEGRRTSSIHDSYQLQKILCDDPKEIAISSQNIQSFSDFGISKRCKNAILTLWFSREMMIVHPKVVIPLVKEVQIFPQWKREVKAASALGLPVSPSGKFWLDNKSLIIIITCPSTIPQHAKHILGYTMSLPKFSQISQGVNIVTLLSSLYFSSELHQGQMKPI